MEHQRQPAELHRACRQIPNAILEQYKTYVEMADRISGCRALANTFFLTLNTAIFTVIGVFLRQIP
ncbi:MAG: RipA family octameric membrane protein, partial [Burkholderiales bacterium]